MLCTLSSARRLSRSLSLKLCQLSSKHSNNNNNLPVYCSRLVTITRRQREVALVKQQRSYTGQLQLTAIIRLLRWILSTPLRVSVNNILDSCVSEKKKKSSRTKDYV